MKLCRILALILVGMIVPLQAAIFTVDTVADSGVGSLREAIIGANGVPGSTIEFAIGSGVQTIILASTSKPAAPRCTASSRKSCPLLCTPCTATNISSGISWRVS